MNHINHIKLSVVSLLGAFLLVSCDGLIDTPLDPELIPNSADSSAVSWTPILVTSVPAMLEIPDEGVADVRSAVAGSTEPQKNTIRKWNQGCVQEWSRITRAIIAKYNIAPFAERNSDGTFTGRFLPNPAKPLASPPFASRMMALIDVGMYDGLIHAWRAKYAVNRPAPYVVDGSIQTLAPRTNLPSYPNEDAVVARIAVECISMFYPSERASMEALYKEATQSRFWAGVARQSDIAGGDSLARFVIGRIKERAANDKWSDVDNQSAWTIREQGIVTQWPRWRSAETPQRPPLHPLGGNVTPWHIVSAESVDPGPPPAETDPVFQRDLEEMRRLVKNRTREQVRIASYWEAGSGTDGPPGMWMKIAEDNSRSRGMSAVRSARVLAYVATALHDAGVACWYTKYKYITARPCTVDTRITMSAGLPNFPGYTSGHSAFSASSAEVLAYFFPSDAASYRAMALEAAESRVYSRIHMRVDCEVGVAQGKDVGKTAIEKARLDGAE